METCPTRFRLLFIHTMQKKQQIRNSTAEFLIFAMQGDAEGIEVRLEDDTVWLTQQMLASLYGSSRTNVLEHIQHIYADEELEESATCRKIRQVQKEGNRNVNRETLFYNLDIIIAVGYRVNSKRATQFRQWATAVLRDFAIRGYVLDRKRMENGKFLGQDYFEHLPAEYPPRLPRNMPKTSLKSTESLKTCFSNPTSIGRWSCLAWGNKNFIDLRNYQKIMKTNDRPLTDLMKAVDSGAAQLPDF